MTLPVRLPSSAACNSRSMSWAASPGGPLGAAGLRLRQQHPREGDVFELPQIRKLVIGRDVLLPCPGESIGQPTLRREHSSAHRRHRPHVRREVAQVDALRLVEQFQRTVEIAVRLAHRRHRDPPPVGVLRHPGVLAQLTRALEMLRGGVDVVTLACDAAEADVHVRRPAERGPDLSGKAQALFERAGRVTQAALGDA